MHTIAKNYNTQKCKFSVFFEKYMGDFDGWRCIDGKIIENWCIVDTLHLMNQLVQNVLCVISS